MITSSRPIAAALGAELVHRYPAETARALERLSPESAAGALAEETGRSISRVIGLMGPIRAADLLAALGVEQLRSTMRALDVPLATRLLARLGDDDRERVLDVCDPSLADELSEVLAYPSTQAGSLMDPRIAAFAADTTAGEALSELREQRDERSRDVMVVGPDASLAGAIPVERIALARLDRTLAELIEEPPTPIQATAPVAEVREHLDALGAHSLPVVDFEGRLVGGIHAHELVEAAQRAVSADLQKMVGASVDERALSSPVTAVRKRLPWLYVNLLTAFVAASVVGLFEGTIARFTALAVLLPVVAGQSGNSGAQALAVTMRGLALRELRASQWRRVALKEVAAGFANGIAISLVTAAGVFVWAQSLGLSVVIALAMVMAMTIAGLAGSLIPIVLRSLGQDPAQSSSIVLTTVTDVAGFLSFLGLATLLASFI